MLAQHERLPQKPKHHIGVIGLIALTSVEFQYHIGIDWKAEFQPLLWTLNASIYDLYGWPYGLFQRDVECNMEMCKMWQMKIEHQHYAYIRRQPNSKRTSNLVLPSMGNVWRLHRTIWTRFETYELLTNQPTECIKWHVKKKWCNAKGNCVDLCDL